MTAWTTKKSKKKVTQEARITQSIKKVLKILHVFHWKHWGGPMGAPGVSDILGIRKVRIADLVAQDVKEVGVFLAIEVKVPGKDPTEDQINFLKRVQAEGGIAMVAYDWWDVVKELKLEHRFR